MPFVIPLTNLLVALVTAIGAAGYVYILGGAVLWARLSEAGWPTEVPVSLASRSELIVMGAQTLVVYLVLLGILAALTVGTMRSGLTIGWITTGGLVGLSLGATILVAFAENSEWMLVFCGGSLFILLVAAAIYRPPTAWLAGLMLLAVGGAASAWVTARLIQDSRVSTLALVWGTFVGVIVAAQYLTVALRRREANLAAVATAEAEVKLLERSLDAMREAKVSPEAWQRIEDALRTARSVSVEMRRKLGVPVEGARRSIWRWGRWLALATAALLVLGGVAIAAQLDETRDFHRAVVRMDNGRCIHGSYLGHDDKRVVLGGRLQNDAPLRVAVIPATRVKALRIHAPRTRPAGLISRRCGGRTLTVTKTPAGAEVTTLEGPPGPRGEPGPPGERGERGAEGDQGDRGPLGDQGEGGRTGAQGERGDRGPKGDRGERGPRGDRGPATVTGRG